MPNLRFPTSLFAVAQKWTGLVMDEFYKQGDEERRLDLPISPFMDREAPKLAQCQKGFLEFICLPLYEAFDGFVNIPEIFAQLQSNAAYWASQVNAPEATVRHGSLAALPLPSHPPPTSPPPAAAAAAKQSTAPSDSAGLDDGAADADADAGSASST